MNIAAVISWKFNDQPGMECREVDGVFQITKFPGGIPTQDEIDQWALEYNKHLKINDLRKACRAHIFAGFDSDALGSTHHYPSKQDATHQDQLNLNGLVTKSYEEPANTFKFWCADSNGAWARREHTAEQIRTAGVDGANHVIAAQDKLAGLIDQVEAAVTETEIGAINW